MTNVANTIWHQVLRFAKSEAGAVTVDWVVLTAALCGMIIMIFTILTESVYEDAASEIGDQIRTASDASN